MTNNTQFSGFQPLRPPLVGSADPPQSSIQPVPVQSWPTVPLQQPQQFLSRVPQHFQSGSNVTPLMNMGMPSVPQHAQFAPLVQHLPLRPVQSIHNTLPPPPVSLPPVSLPVSQPNNPIVSESLLPSPLVTNTFMPPMGTPVTPLPSSSFTFASQGGQHQMNFVVPRPSPSQYYPISRPHPSSASTGEQVNLLSESVNTVSVGTLQHTSEQPSVSAVVAPGMSVQRNFSGAVQTDWIEHTSANGKRYYYNKKTKLSSWEKPLELMTAIELADASTNWKEITSSDGRIYYYNKVTKQSKWEMPEELKSARQQVNDSSPTGTQSESLSVSSTSVAAISTPNGTHVPSSIAQESASSPVSVTPTDASGNKEAAVVTESATLPNVVSAAAPVAVGLDASLDDAEQSIASRGTNEAAANMIEIDQGQSTTQDIPCSSDEASVQEIKKDEVTAEKPDKFIHEKLLNSEPVLYASKLEAKNAFKALLENASVGSDWTWERAMRVIINDKRYGALKTLGEKKEAFNEFVAQRRKQEAEEKRSQQKKARENFRQMLEGCQELTSSSRWSKVETWFEGDERFKAIERDRDRKDLFENFIHDLEIKEREKALEERKKNIREYRQFLESCDFIKASSQWRKLQDRLEADERCMRLEKIDRLEIFQEYLRDLEKEEEEQKKIQKEEMRKVERKNRDEFRKLLEEHVAAGTLTAKTHWRDYYMMVRDVPAYLAVASNTVGSTPKDLFEDVAEELKKQYDEDKSLIEDAVKLRKVCLMSSWTVEDLKASIADDVHCPPTSEINFKLVFDELLERAKKKEEKEAKKRKRLGDKFFDLLLSAREITPSSKWEDCRQLVESSYEYSSIADDSYCKEIFEEYITKLKDHEKRKYKEEKTEREREKHGKERKRVKARREKERHVREEESRDDVADAEIQLSSKKRKSGKDRERKHLKQHHSTEENIEIAERDRWEKSCRHVDDYGKATEVQDASTPESDCENQHKNHKKDDRNFSNKNGGYEELEDGEFGEDGRSW